MYGLVYSKQEGNTCSWYPSNIGALKALEFANTMHTNTLVSPVFALVYEN